MKKIASALLFSLLAVLLMGAAASTSLVYVDTTSRALTGNIVAGNNTTISASGNGTITATAAPLSGLTGLGTGVGTFLATPSSANLASAVTNETGSGALVFATSPTLVTPVLGAATGTSLSLGGPAVTSNIFTVSGSGTIGNATAGAVTTPQLFSQSWYSSGIVFNNSKTDSSDVRNWAIATDRVAYGDLHIRQSNALGGDPLSAGTSALSFDFNRDATFAGTGNFKGGSLTVTNAANTANIIRSSDASGNAVDAAYKATGTTYAVQTTDTGGNLKTALTLDSSQNATFAGTVTVNGRDLLVNSGGPRVLWKDTSNTQDLWQASVDNDSTQGWNLINNTSGYGTVMRFSRLGALRLNNYGAGTLSTDSSGNVTASSDARLKTNVRSFTRGLSDVVKISPKTFNWTEASGLDTQNDYSGFIAQDVQAAIPEAVYEGKDEAKTLSLNDRAVIAALVNAVKELKAEVDALKAARN